MTVVITSTWVDGEVKDDLHSTERRKKPRKTYTMTQTTRKNMGNPIVSHRASPQHAHVLMVRSTFKALSIMNQGDG
jgi:hypothetical protein